MSSTNHICFWQDYVLVFVSLVHGVALTLFPEVDFCVFFFTWRITVGCCEYHKHKK